jgi:hypothetical protein
MMGLLDLELLRGLLFGGILLRSVLVSLAGSVMTMLGLRVGLEFDISVSKYVASRLPGNPS